MMFVFRRPVGLKCTWWPAACLLAGLWPVAFVHAEALSLEGAVVEASAQNSALAASVAQVDAAQAAVSQAGALADPRLSIGLLNLPGELALDQDPMSQLQIGVSQALPFPGKRALAEDAAGYRAEAVGQTSAQLQRQLTQQVRYQWWQLFYLQQAIQVVNINRSLMTQAVETAESLYVVGRGRQQDVLLAELQLAKLDDQGLRLTEAWQRAEAEMNHLLNRPASQPLVLSVKVPPLPDVITNEANMRQRVLDSHPDVRAAVAQVAAARSLHRLSERDAYPDFVVGLSHGLRDDRDDLTSIQFSMSLPLYAGRKQDRAQDQRQAEWIAARYQLDEVRARLGREFDQALAGYRRALKQVELYRERILPQAQQAVDVILAAYESDRASLPQLLQAQATQHDYQTQYWQAYAAANQRWAALQALAGEMNHE